MSQNKYMEKALQLANKAKKINEIPVGSVVVDSSSLWFLALGNHRNGSVRSIRGNLQDHP